MSETRKPAAILVPDLVGYSRLAGADEERTLARLRGLRSDLIDPAIDAHPGRIIKRTGDGSIIEFRGAVDAVRWAIEDKAPWSSATPGCRRIGASSSAWAIHLDNVVEERAGDPMGDGINIAARLEGIADPGAICLDDSMRGDPGFFDVDQRLRELSAKRDELFTSPSGRLNKFAAYADWRFGIAAGGKAVTASEVFDQGRNESQSGEQAAKTTIFISYSRKNMAFADRLEAGFKAKGFEPLIDRDEIYAFEDWWKRIQSLIAQADTIVFVLSPDSVASNVCAKEVAYGASLNKRFAPIVFQRVDDNLIPEAMARLNFVFFDDETRFDECLARLCNALSTDIGWIRKHTEYGEAARQWGADAKPAGLLLRSPALEEAERWIASRPSAAPLPTVEMQEFIVASRRGATRRRDILTSSLAAGLIVALGLAGLAYWQSQIAQRNFVAAQSAVDGLVFNIAEGLRNVAGVRVETIRKILETSRQTVDQLLATAPDDARLLRSQAGMLLNFSQTYLDAGDLKDALTAARQGVDIARKLLARNPQDTQAQKDLARILERLGQARRRQGDMAGALAAYQEAFDLDKKVAVRDSGDAKAQGFLALDLDYLGEVKNQMGDQDGAFAAAQSSLDIRRKVVAAEPDDAAAQRELGSALSDLGRLKQQAGDLNDALAAFQEGLNLDQKLALAAPDDTVAQFDLSVSWSEVAEVKMLAGDLAAARAPFEQSLDIRRKLVTLDPGSAFAQRNLSFALESLAGLKLRTGDRTGALADFQEGVGLRRKIVGKDPGNAAAQSDLALILGRYGKIEL
jgi:tetratricopeptide (TPR) repeat protein